MIRESLLVVSANQNVYDIANYLIFLHNKSNNIPIEKVALQKLLYFAQGNYLAATGHRLFNNDCEAFDMGPVIYDVFNKYRLIEWIELPYLDIVQSPLPEYVKIFLNDFWYKYGTLSWKELTERSHEHEPWKKYTGAFRSLIPDDEIKQFFLNEVPLSQRVFHPNVTLVTQEFLNEM